MTTHTLTLSDFLLARIAEDEEVARAAGDGSWAEGERCVWRESPVYVLDIVTDGQDGEGGAQTPEIARHIATHDPARVLAECEAKRALVEEHAAVDDRSIYVSGGIVCRKCVEFHADMDCQHETAPCLTIRALALPYADHPDYREEWRV